MGYHVVTGQLGGVLDHRYVETLEDMCEFSDLTAHTIVYQGEPDWKPVMLKDDKVYAPFAHDWFRAGIKAQRLFKAQCRQALLVAEPIAQDRDTFADYTNVSTHRVKRGDYLVRKAQAEVEVKCLTSYGEDSFFLPYSDIKAHEHMQTLTNSPVILAIYERAGDTPKPDSLCMVEISKVLAENNRSVRYHAKSKCLIVPKRLTTPALKLLLDRTK